MTAALDALPLTPDALRHARTLADYLQRSAPEQVEAHAQAAKLKVAGIVEWGEKNFYIPSDDSRPRLIRFLPHQKTILDLFFNPEIAQALGCWPNFQTLVYSTVKKSGKTAIAALVARWITETWGSHAEVYALANDMEQARGRIYAAALASIELDPRYTRADKGIAGLWRIIEREAAFLPTHSALKAVSSDYKGEAGSNPTATLWSELWGYNTEASQRLWEELTPVPTRPRSIRYVETYAGYENESGILNDLEDRLKDPQAGSRRLTRDELEWLGLEWPFPDEHELPFYIHTASRTIAYWDSGPQARRMPWQTKEYYDAQQAELRPPQFDRLHSNIRISAADEFIPIEWWDRLDLTTAVAVGELPAPPLDPKTPVVIGADASVSGDCTALSMVSRDRRPGQNSNVMQQLFEAWEPYGGPLDYSKTIEPQLLRWCTGHIHWPHEKCDSHSKIDVLGPCHPVPAYNVVAVVYDPYQLHDLMTRMRNAGVAWCKPFSQQGARMEADKMFYDLIRDQRIHHRGNTTLRQHIMQCAAKIPPGDNTRLRLVKKGTKSKIDGAVATSMASHECLRLILE